MKKLFFAAALTAALLGGGSALAVGVTVNGNAVSFNADLGYPFIENGRTLVPLRAAAESYGAVVGFDGASSAATVAKDGVTVTIPIGEAKIYRNGSAIENDVAARIVDSRTYLPIRAVMEALGANVGWDGTNVTVENPDVSFVAAIENGAELGEAVVWKRWNSAVQKQASGDYNGAIAEYREVAPRFKREAADNMALLFQHLGECYGELGEFHSAAVCYRRSSYYWEQNPTQKQTAMYYANMADYVDTDVRLYLKTDDKAYDRTKYFGAPSENKSGIILGTTDNSTTEALTGIKHGVLLQYFNFDDEFVIDKDADVIWEIAWQPQRYGVSCLNEIEENDFLIGKAKELESLGRPVLLRFANEMNDETCPWYTADYNLYIEKFRIVARVMHQYAPSVAVVWSPNFYPSQTVDLYYPGDEYVDYVGLSVYQEYNGASDPLGKGVERGRWSNILDKVYSTYGERKPIIVSEGGCSYKNIRTGEDITDFAVKQMKDYYTYLPIKYPNLKIAVLFNQIDRGGRSFLLEQNPALAESYKKGITSSGRYLSDPADEPSAEYYSELCSGITLPAKQTELCSFISSPINEFSYVIYEINGQETAAYEIPYTVSVDLSPYAGQTITVRVRAFGNAEYVEETFNIKVKNV